MRRKRFQSALFSRVTKALLKSPMAVLTKHISAFGFCTLRNIVCKPFGPKERGVHTFHMIQDEVMRDVVRDQVKHQGIQGRFR